nr:ATP-binding cassette domain-containing protein [Arsenicicoccus dermatophilus]
MVATLPADAPVTDLAAAVTGRPFAGLYPAIRPQAPAGQATTRPLLVAEGLAVPGILAPTTVEVRAGEVVGVEGGTPTTRSALLRALVGGIPQAQGRVQIGECTIRPGQVQEAIRAGVGYVPADRQGAGLVPQASAADNLWYGVLTRGRTGPNGPSRTEQIAVVRERLAIAAPSMDDPVARLSGGNQQKVVVGRWVAARSQVLVLDEPTRGVDVGAREVIYQVVAEIVAGGGAVVLASSDRQEMDALCTRTISVPAQEPGALMGSGAELRSSP